jgi:hypothetical protein
MRRETSHAVIAHSRLTDAGRRNVELAAILEALAEPIQEVEDAYWALFEDRRLDVAVATQLDVLGAIIGQPRNGFGDTDYRSHISARIMANRSSGTVEELLTLVRTMLSAGTLTLTQTYPAGFVIHVGVADISAAIVPIVMGLLRSARQAGVRGILEFMSGTTDADTFTLDGGGGLGFGDATTPATGGGMAGALS